MSRLVCLSVQFAVECCFQCCEVAVDLFLSVQFAEVRWVLEFLCGGLLLMYVHFPEGVGSVN